MAKRLHEVLPRLGIEAESKEKFLTLYTHFGYLFIRVLLIYLFYFVVLSMYCRHDYEYEVEPEKQGFPFMEFVIQRLQFFVLQGLLFTNNFTTNKIAIFHNIDRWYFLGNWYGPWHFEHGVGRLLKSVGLRRINQSHPGSKSWVFVEGLMLKLKLDALAT